MSRLPPRAATPSHSPPHAQERPDPAHAPVARARPKQVFLAGPLAALDAPGGGEIQMREIERALAAAGIAARTWRPWDDDQIEADVFHLFGSVPGHLAVVGAARRRRAAVVLSPIAWFEWSCCWREPWPLGRRIAAAGKFLARSMCPWIPSWRRELYHSVDLLLPNSNAEARQLIRYFGVSPRRIHVVPNGAHERFAVSPSTNALGFRGARNYVLYAGRIEPRKNQLGFLRAMQGVNLPIVILGDPVPGHEAYYEACARAADADVTFVPRLRHDDPELLAAYASARCVVLASWYETPGLVALEAAMQGLPLVLPRSGAAPEYFGPWARYVRTGDASDLRAKVLAAYASERSSELAALAQRNYTWQAAAVATEEAYAQVL